MCCLVHVGDGLAERHARFEPDLQGADLGTDASCCAGFAVNRKGGVVVDDQVEQASFRRAGVVAARAEAAGRQRNA